MRAFVTGATGFIGRRLVERLQRDGIEVIALVRSHRHGLPEATRIVFGDILRPDSLGDFGLGCDRLYHLAALITFDPRRRAELLRINGEGTSNILNAAHRWNVKRSVVVSSACTIGLSFKQDDLLDEDSPLTKEFLENNPYLDSKVFTERAAMAAALKQGVVVVNPTTVYGPGDRTLNSGTLVLRIAHSAVVPVPPGGSNVVDVDDIVEGILAAGERGQSGRRYILGGVNLSFKQIFSTIANVVGRQPFLLPIPSWTREPVSVAASIVGRLAKSRFLTPQIMGDLFGFKYYSNARAQQELGWKPRYSFQESVLRAWAFYKEEELV